MDIIGDAVSYMCFAPTQRYLVDIIIGDSGGNTAKVHAKFNKQPNIINFYNNGSYIYYVSCIAQIYICGKVNKKISHQLLTEKR